MAMARGLGAVQYQSRSMALKADGDDIGEHEHMEIWEQHFKVTL